MAKASKRGRPRGPTTSSDTLIEQRALEFKRLGIPLTTALQKAVEEMDGLTDLSRAFMPGETQQVRNARLKALGQIDKETNRNERVFNSKTQKLLSEPVHKQVVKNSIPFGSVDDEVAPSSFGPQKVAANDPAVKRNYERISQKSR